MCLVDGASEPIQSIYLRTYQSGLRRPTLVLPTLSLSLISISSIKERMSRRLTLKRSVLSYCQSIWDGRLFKFNDLPEWMKDNEYITDMHRPQVSFIEPLHSSYLAFRSKTFYPAFDQYLASMLKLEIFGRI